MLFIEQQMNTTHRESKSRWFLWAGLLLTAATLLLALLLAEAKRVERSSLPLPILGTVSDFTLTNQDGRAVSLADLSGRVWVADIIFTRCAGPCLRMSRQMKELQQALPSGSEARLVSLTTDPDYDTPLVVKTYAKRFEANPARWMFLTGTKKQIANLAVDSLKLTAVEKQPEERASPEDLFIHSTIFVAVDKQARLRGIFETTGEGIDPRQVKAQILSAVNRLERER
jgi:cytochrome oxidase Cu insertion factor (SCO1/SenC/PrrC family)